MFFWNRLKKENEMLKQDNLRLLQELSESKRPFFWVLDTLSEEDYKIMKENARVIELIKQELLVRYLRKQDTIRNLRSPETLEEKVWYLNCLNELHVFFSNLLTPELTEEEKIWQNLK